MKRYGEAINAYYQFKEVNLGKGYILYDSNYMTFWKRQNIYGDSKKISMLGAEVGKKE